MKNLKNTRSCRSNINITRIEKKEQILTLLKNTIGSVIPEKTSPLIALMGQLDRELTATVSFLTFWHKLHKSKENFKKLFKAVRLGCLQNFQYDIIRYGIISTGRSINIKG